MALARITTISARFSFVTPMLFAVVIIALIVSDYVRDISKEINTELAHVEHSLSRAIKIVGSLNYGITTQFAGDTSQAIPHHISVKDGLCRAKPVSNKQDGEQDVDGLLNVARLDYLILGAESMCQEGSALYQAVSKRVALAPVISFLHDLDDFLVAAHYISSDSYIITSPESVALTLDKPLVMSVTDRPFWKKTAEGGDQITVTGPLTRGEAQKEILYLSSPVIEDGVYRGAVMVDISVEKLLTSESNPNYRYRLINRKTTPIPNSAWLVKDIEMQGVNFSHSLYYQFELMAEIVRFLEEEKGALLTVLGLYIVSVIGLMYLNSQVERRYFKELAEKDPMTGLLNRRGLELHCRIPSKFNYIALGVFDVDDFKKVNDTYGHDKGDDVLRYVAGQIRASVRGTDAVARIGGEEFVVYLRGDSKQGMSDVLERVREVVVADSTKALEAGFTISGGVSIIDALEKVTFNQQFKMADEKLYVAKTTGKNKVVF